MKRILSFITVFALLLTACEGEQGPPGFDGVNFVGQSFEGTVNFINPDYQASLEIPLNIELIESDMVLTYRLVGIDNEGYDIWRPLPEIVYTDNGNEFQYTFDHNFDFVDLFIYAPPTFDRSTLPEADRIGQTFRIVVLPVDLVNSIDLDVNNLSEVMQYVE
ncbi:dihydrolipoamide dehydrogenase [Winogradskyella echinorum]|uniref:Dihydrolipoamide dehydrogenase n=1 Tax=Winogradskyella echinorum TaxID=538189 RepID=A0ABR6Y0C9_9FLAO|nr:dihydrolipoamide dehydrogenase [Winogradskyella echinorum]MBC3846187.1 dihydrolipoamide dehydrogenase [Winogradskyella echinorum]MBC5750535.1 dihydrolipoamide dehydrogenase [Winogradskyella echinorum]